MKIIDNPFRGGEKLAENAPYPSTNAERAEEVISATLAVDETPLTRADGLAPVADFWIKDERGRAGLGSFKALGAAYVIARHAMDVDPNPSVETLSGRTYVTASAGNHGLSLAFGARKFGAQSVVYIAETVPEGFADRLREQGAKVAREGSDYAASMEAAARYAEESGSILLSDSSWDGYTELPHILMEGYQKMAAEACRQSADVPTHVFLQAGVGGLAGAVAAYVRRVWGDAPHITVVEPEAAPALQASIEAGKCVFADGPDSIMGRLDCKEPSLIAVNGLARDADAFLTLTDAQVEEQLPKMAASGFATSASGGAGVAAAVREDVRAQVGIDKNSRILCFLSEGEA